MSKSSKARSKQENLKKKRAIKQSNEARYAELRRQGENGKSIRFKRNNKISRLVKRVDHPDGRCGNIACKKCFPLKTVI